MGSARRSVFAWNQINTTNKKICKTSRFRDRGTSKSTIADSDAAIIYPDTALKTHIAILKLQTILKLQIPDAFTLIHAPETLERDREIY